MGQIVKYISVFTAGCLVGILLFWLNKSEAPKPIVEVVKEVVYIDTNSVPEPVVVPELTILEEYFLIENPDLLARDTLPKIHLRKETKTYKDSTFMAVVSGYNPSLDYIETYNRTKCITVEKKPLKWFISAIGGVSFTGNAGSLYGAGEIGYSNKGWTISGELGRDFTLKQNYVGFEVSRDIARW